MFSFLAVFVAILILPVATTASGGISGHGTSQLYANEIAYGAAGQRNGTINALPFSLVNGTASISNSYIVGSGANNTTVYGNYATDYIVSNVTFNQLNEHSANTYKAFISPASSNGSLTAILGFGTYSSSANGTSLKFTPLLSGNFSGKNNTANVSFSLNPAELTENGSNVLILEVQNVNASSFSFSGYVIGTHSAQPWYLVGENAAYALGGTFLFAFGFLALPHFDLNISKTEMPVINRKPKKKASTANQNAKKTMQKYKVGNKGGRK